LTIGHSTHPPDKFLDLLQSHGVQRLIDVRTIPRSRHNPQFNKENLAVNLPSRAIEYTHMPELGGLRHARRDSKNLGWRNASFRGYADYMQTSEFTAALRKLIDQAQEKPVAIMCAEAVPWRCHRSLIADALTARGIHVAHIMSAKSAPEHTLTPFARVLRGRVTYPAPSAGSGSA
jgi:uncharacterized protein (DUF488 family)